MNKILLNAATRVLLSWIIVSIILLFAGRHLIQLYFPLCRWVMGHFSHEYSGIRLFITNGPNERYQVEALVEVVKSIGSNGVVLFPAWSQIAVANNLDHHLVPIAIFYSVLLAWPVAKPDHRVLLILLGIPFSWLMLSLIMPASISGLIEMKIDSAVQQVGGSSREHWVVSWTIFLECGARWVLPLLFAVLCVRTGEKIIKISHE